VPWPEPIHDQGPSPFLVTPPGVIPVTLPSGDEAIDPPDSGTSRVPPLAIGDGPPTLGPSNQGGQTLNAPTTSPASRGPSPRPCAIVKMTTAPANMISHLPNHVTDMRLRRWCNRRRSVASSVGSTPTSVASGRR